MAHEVYQSGLSRGGNHTPTSSRRNALYMSNGDLLIVVGDTNDSDCPSGWGTGTDDQKIFVYHSSDRVTFTRVATIVPDDPLRMPMIVNADLFDDDSLGVVWINDDKEVKYCKVNNVGGGDWTAGSQEEIAPAHSGSPGYNDCDITIGNNVPSVALFYGDSTGGGGANYCGLRVHTRRTSDSTWVLSQQTILLTDVALQGGTQDISLQSLDGGSGTARPIALSVSYCRQNHDYGVTIYAGTLNESTGAMSGWSDRRTLDIGDIPNNISWPGRPRKTYIFRSGTNEFAFGLMTWYTDPRFIAAIYGWDGTDFTTKIQPSTFKPGFGRLYGENNLSMTFGSDVFNFITAAQTGGRSVGQEDPVNYVATIDRDLDTISWSGFFHWNNNGDPVTVSYILGGTGRNTDQTTHDSIYYHEYNDNKFTLVHRHAFQNVAPHAVSPKDSSTMTTSTPPVSLDADIDMRSPEALMKGVWHIDTSSGFPDPMKFQQTDDKFAKVEGTDVDGVYHKFTDTWPSSMELEQGVTWYIRGASLDQFGNLSPWEVNSAGFIISHPPAAANLQPTNGQAVSYGTNGSVFLSWEFTDPYDKDLQTAFQIQIAVNETGSVLEDTGKLTSGQTNYLSDPIGSGHKNELLKWRVKLWDKDDIEGAYSKWVTFVEVDPATIGIISPDGVTDVITPRPYIIFEGDASPLADITFYRVSIEQSGQLVYDSDWVPYSASGSYSINYRLATSVLHNDNNYTAVAQVRDAHQVESEDRVQFHTAWTPPATPADQSVNVALYNTPDKGYIAVTWSDDDRDAAFLCWVIYRQVDVLVSPGFGDDLPVYEVGEEEEVFRDFTIQDDYEYDDYFAPTGSRISYRVSQIITEYGDEVESDDEGSIIVFPESDGYWLIDPDPPAPGDTAFKLSIVTADEYTDEYEEAEYDIIGRGRHYEQGSHWGITGSMTLQLRDDSGTTARSKKQRLENLKSRVTLFYLRTPFGDIYFVYVGNLQVSRLAGVGQSEYATVTIPYSQVSRS